MAGHNLFLLSPALSNANATITARAYLRYRPDDASRGTEIDMGVDTPATFHCNPVAFNAGDSTLIAAVTASLSSNYDGLAIAAADMTTGLQRFFISKEWLRIKP
tara:strand:+ start:205 stop:516 length:312 start_codon:yes stop_codon:yes gene_type:complete